MEQTFDKLREERKKIISEYSSKSIENTHIDEEVDTINELLYVRIKKIIKETSDTKSFILEPDNEKTNSLEPFKAGQYISVKLEINGLPVSRAYSLSSSPTNYDTYRITVKRVNNGLVSNYMLDELKVGDKLVVSRPMGEFTYNKIRDENNVIGIAGGSGITPFISLAHAVLNGVHDINLTVIYSVKKYEDIIFRNEIETLNKNKNIKFLITLTREEKEGYLYGHVTKKMLEPYIKEFNTIFMCGPKTLYKSMNEILIEFNIPKKSVHFENFSIEYVPPLKSTFELKVITKDDFVVTTCKSDETLLVAMEKAVVKAPSMCRVGVCGYCRSILLEGKVKMIGAIQANALNENDYIHPCVSYPESDIVLKLDI